MSDLRGVSGRVGDADQALAVPAEPASGLVAPRFDPSRFNIPWPREDETIHLNLVKRAKWVSLWWSVRDRDGWCDGGCISAHRSRRSAQAKAREVAAWLGQRAASAMGAGTAETLQAAQGDSPPARAEGDAQPSDPLSGSIPNG